MEGIFSYLISSFLGWGFSLFGIDGPFLRHLLSILLFLCIFLLYKLIQMKTLIKKVHIGRKAYYDVMSDMLYYNINAPRNKFEICDLEWDFELNYNQESEYFLDLHAKWCLTFTAPRFSSVKSVNIGIQGGPEEKLSRMHFEAYQETQKLMTSYINYKTFCDIPLLCLDLESDVQRGKAGRVTVMYSWEKFVVTDRDDDYIYLLPKAHAKRIKNFTLNIKHPYPCIVAIYILRCDLFSGYQRNLIDHESEVQYNAKIENISSTELKFTIQEPRSSDVILIIFGKK